MQIKIDSFKKRYVFKLASNLVGFGANLVIAGVVPSTLGPSRYGNFMFLSNFFKRLFGIFAASTSHAFYTKISQRQKEIGLLRFYWSLFFLFTLLTSGVVATILLSGNRDLIWPNQQTKYIWMALLWAILTWGFQTTEKILDAYGLTVKAQLIGIVQKVLKVVLILGLYFAKQLNLTHFFIYHYIILTVIVVLWWKLLRDHDIPLFPNMRLGLNKVKKYTAEFYEYSSPLIVFTVFSFVFEVMDLWLLERFSGSVEQGFYGLAFQIGSLCFLFTSSMTPLLMREFSVSHAKADLEKMRYYFSKYIPLLFTITAIIAVYLSMQADKIRLIIGGEQYAGATLAIALMAFHPIHKTYGQLSNSLFFATGRTKLHRNLGLFEMTIAFAVSFYLLAPKEFYGLHLGAVGLAIKMLVAQLISVYVRLWFNTRYLKLSYWKFVLHNISSVIFVGAIAWSCVSVTDVFVPTDVWIQLMVGSVLYAVCLAAGLFVFPGVVKMSRNELITKCRDVLRRLRIVTE